MVVVVVVIVVVSVFVYVNISTCVFLSVNDIWPIRSCFLFLKVFSRTPGERKPMIGTG